MKRRDVLTLLLLMILSVSNTVFGQTDIQQENFTRDFKKNEVSLNLMMSVVGVPEIEYERFLEDNFGVGLSLSTLLLREDKYPYLFTGLTFGRLYFGKKPNSGFYIEGNVGYLFMNEDFGKSSSEDLSGKHDSGLGIGVALGYKFLTKNNWTGTISYGGGRFISKGNNGYFYPRFGLLIGKRF